MVRHMISRRIPRRSRWLVALASLALAAAGCVPLAASAGSETYGVGATSAAAGGVAFGGHTSQGWPMFVELKNRRRIAETRIGFDMRCTSGDFYSDWEVWVGLRINGRHKFSARFGPETRRFNDGTTADFWGEISGTVNRAGSKISGRAHFEAVYYDTAAAVSDRCASGTLSWTAKQ